MNPSSAPSRLRSFYDVMEVFSTEQECVEHLARLRWPNGPVCPECGTIGRAYRISLRYKCAYCRTFFSVRKDTIFEESKVSLRKWFAAIFLFMSNRKGISSYQLARDIGVKQHTAWFMLSRLQHVADNMAVEILRGVVEVDEAYVGGRNRNRHWNKKYPNWADGFQVVIGAVEPNGSVIADRVPSRDRPVLQGFIGKRIHRGSRVYTDDLPSYRKMKGFTHRKVNHNTGQYVNGDVHTQTIESFWAILKRAHKGVYHLWSHKHFDLYLREFELRWNVRRLPEGDRIDVFLRHVNGTRLSYEDLKNGQRPVLRAKRVGAPKTSRRTSKGQIRRRPGGSQRGSVRQLPDGNPDDATGHAAADP